MFVLGGNNAVGLHPIPDPGLCWLDRHRVWRLVLRDQRVAGWFANVGAIPMGHYSDPL